jgi:hypothetical protein
MDANIRLVKKIHIEGKKLRYICRFRFKEIPDLLKWWRWWRDNPYKFRATTGNKYHSKFSEFLSIRLFDIPKLSVG